MELSDINFNLMQINIPENPFGKKRWKFILGWVGAFCICFAAVSANIDQTSFGGSWNLNVTKSDFVDLNPFDAAPRKIKVIQTNDSITIEKGFRHSDGSENSYIETFYNDGRLTERMASPTTKRLTTIKWSTDKDTLIINAHSYVNNRGLKYEYNTNEKWIMANGGQSLIVQRKSVMPDRTETYKAVYDKQ